MKMLLRLVLLIGLLALVCPAGAATPTPVVSDTVGITGFELYGTGLLWWNSPGNCSSEFPRDGTIRVRGTITSGTTSLARSCHLHQGDHTHAVRDEAYVYYFEDRQLMRKAVNATQSAAGQVLVTTNYNPTLSTAQTGAVLELAEGWLYWPRRNTTSTDIFRMPADGSSAPELVVRYNHAADVRKIEWFLCYDGDGASAASVAVLFADGWLYRTKIHVTDGTAFLGSGFADFAIHSRGMILTRVTYIYAAKGRDPSTVAPSTSPGQLLRINAETLESAVIYTALGNNQVLSVATDSDQGLVVVGGASKYIYVGEAVMSCGALLCSWTDTVIKRHTTPGSTTGWDQIVTTGGGFNLRSDDDFLYFLNTEATAIKRISTDAPPQLLDVRADAVEVVQALQDLNSSVKLVSGHPTYVRGYAHLTTNTTGRSAWYPSVVLYGYLNGQLLPGSPLIPINNPPIEAYTPLMQRRSRLDRSFLFELPSDDTRTNCWVPPMHGTLQFKMVINEGLDVAETGPNPALNNSVWLKNPATLVARGRPCVTYVPMLVVGPVASTVPGVSPRAASLLPIAGLAGNSYFWTLGDPEEPYDIGSADAGVRDGAMSDMLDDLASFSWYPCGDWNVRKYLGMVHASLGPFNGVSRINTDTMVVRMEPGPRSGLSAGGGVTIAHEAGHCFGRQHINCGDFPADQANFDPSDFPCSLGDPEANETNALFGFDYIDQRVILPDSAADLMSYAPTRWTGPVTWEALLQRMPTPDMSKAGPPPIDLEKAAEVLLVQGRVNPARRLGYFRSITTLPIALAPARRVKESRDLAERLKDASENYLFRQLDQAGRFLSETPVQSVEGHSEEEYRLAFNSFIQYIDLAPHAFALQLTRSNHVYAERFLSPNPPSASIVTVRVDQAAQTLYVRWTMADADGDPLRATLQYGAGCCGEWTGLLLNSRNLEVTVPTQRLPGSPQARVRLIVTDGVRTAIATSDPFLMPDQPPVIEFSGVNPEKRLPFGTSAILTASATDPETGGESNRLVLIVSGPVSVGLTGVVEQISLPLRDLPPGPYTATMTATDPAGQTNSANRPFHILPMTIPDGTAPSLDGLCNDPGYTNAVVVRLPWSGGQIIPVRLLHSGSNLFVSFSNLKYSSTPLFNRSAGLRVEADGGGSSTPSSSDRGFYVNEDGIQSQEVGAGASGMVVTATPAAGFAAVIRRGSNTWSAELRIADALLGGWNHAVRLMITHSSAVWPGSAASTSPATWGPTYLGTSPPAPSNRRPVAVAGENQRISLRTARVIHLNGGGSYDPDGDPLQYAWRQTRGPMVTLVNSNTPTPHFDATPVASNSRLTFELVVNDGRSSSPASATEVTLVPPALRPPDPAPSAYARLRTDGALQFRLTGEPRTLYRLEISTDLEAWQLLRNIYADELGLIDLTENVDFEHYPKLFYRVISP